MAKQKKNKKKHIAKSASKKSTNTGFFFNKQYHLIGIFGLACILYFNTLGHEFTQDDAIVIYENDFTKKGVAGIKDILTKDTFHGFFGKQKDLVAGGRYRPLSLVMFAIGYQMFGASTFIGHLINILLYGLTGILIYLLLLKMLSPKESRKLYPWFVALGTALLFIAHPIHTEAVANIKGRDEILALLASLGATYLILQAWYEKNDTLSYFAGGVFFLGLMAKENTVTFLAIIPFTLYFFTKAKNSDIIKLTFPVLIGFIAFMAIRTSILGIDMGTESREIMNNAFFGMSAGEKLATIMFTLGKYVQLLIAPITLTHDYYPFHISKMSWGNWKVLLSLAVYIGMTAYALVQFTKKDKIAYGILFFLASLSIVSNIVVSIGTNMSERFMYMPSVGFCFVVVLLLYKLGNVLNKKDELKVSDLKIPTAILGVMVVLFSIKTIDRNKAWESNYTLFTTDIKTSKNSAKLRNAVGGEIIAVSLKEKNEAIQEIANMADPNQKKQREAQIDGQFQSKVSEALVHLNEAARLHPTYANAYLQLGNANNYLKNFPKAFESYNKSLQYKQNSSEALSNLAITYKDAANHIGTTNNQANYSTALGYYQNSINTFEKLKPFAKDINVVKQQMAATYLDWGRFYGEKLQNFNEALVYLKKAQELDPKGQEVYRLMGLCYASSGRLDEAITLFNDLIKKQPDNANLYFNLGAFYGQKGDTAKAQELRQKAISMDPSLGR